MLASGNDLLKEKIALKEHNSALADMISKLNGYITQLRASAPTDNLTNTQPLLTTSHREQNISDTPLFTGDKSKARAWIMDMRLKLAADIQFFRTEQAKMIYVNSRLEGPVKDQIHPFMHDDLTFKIADANAIVVISNFPLRWPQPTQVCGKCSRKSTPTQQIFYGFYAWIYPLDERRWVYRWPVQDWPTLRQTFRWNESAVDWTRYASRLLGICYSASQIRYRCSCSRSTKIPAHKFSIQPCCSRKSDQFQLHIYPQFRTPITCF